MRAERSLAIIGFLFCLLAGIPVSAGTWSGFRGAAGDAVSEETDLPTTWSADSLAWKTSLRGKGNSSPAVMSKLIFVTSQDETDESLWVIAVDRENGRVRWDKMIGGGALTAYGPPELFNYRHNPATPSPVADEEHVWAFFGTGDLVCLDHSGKIVWRKNLADEYGAFDLKFGMGSSPRLWGDMLFVTCLHKGPSYVLALDKLTGKERWLTPRDLPADGDAPDSYTSPAVLQSKAGPAQLIVSGCDHVDAYDLLTGKRTWLSAGLKIPKEEYSRIIVSPAVGEGVVVASSAKAHHAIALAADGSGDVTTTHQLWKVDFMADCPTPTIHNGLVYSVRDNGVGTCLDLRTGQVLWQKRIGGGDYRASPVVGGGKVYFLGIKGDCKVIGEGREFKEIAENRLDGDFYATPAISNGMIILRDRSNLIAIGNVDSATLRASLPATAHAANEGPDFAPVVDLLRVPENITLGAVSAVAVNSKGQIYILHRAKPPVMCFEASGAFVRSWGDNLIGKGHGLSIDRHDNVWVTDTDHHLVFKFDANGKLLLALGQADKPGPGDDQFDQPTYALVGPDDEIYVADGYGKNQRMVKLSPQGKFLRAWGKPGKEPGEFNSPHTMVIDSQRRLLVADRDNERIQIFDREGSLLTILSGGYTPFGLALDPDGVLFVADGKANKILQLGAQGNVVRSWGKTGAGPGEFNTVHLLSADSAGNLYAAEVGGKRMQKLERK